MTQQYYRVVSTALIRQILRLYIYSGPLESRCLGPLASLWSMDYGNQAMFMPLIPPTSVEAEIIFSAHGLFLFQLTIPFDRHVEISKIFLDC